MVNRNMHTYCHLLLAPKYYTIMYRKQEIAYTSYEKVGT